MTTSIKRSSLLLERVSLSLAGLVCWLVDPAAAVNGAGFVASAAAYDLSEPQCRQCHCDDVPDRHHEAAAVADQPCLSCHEMVWQPVALEYLPEVVRDCPACHGPSTSDRHHLLVESQSLACLDCHEMVLDPVELTYTIEMGFSCAIAGPCQGLPPGTPCTGDGDCDGSTGAGSSLGTPCTVGYGICATDGVQICDPAGSGVICSAEPGLPTQEVCDGLDNDCDGAIDDGFAVGSPCDVGVGACRATGQLTCNDLGDGVTCNAVPHAASPETCDDVDNDCDGQVDEGFGLGAICSAGTGACSTFGQLRCSDSGDGTTCDAVPGDGTAEICDGIDNDCNGTIDDGFGVGSECTAGVGDCQVTGEWVCSAAGDGRVCDAAPGDGSPEACDGIDNDCDGQVDEVFAVGAECVRGIGACAVQGTFVCAAGGGSVECSAQPGEPTAELCDGIDNDCDGVIDEDYVEIGAPCTAGTGACQTSGQLVCGLDGSGVMCNAQPGEMSEEICDGIDNDCNGAIDEGFMLAEVCSVGVGACLGFGETVCSDSGLAVECDAEPGVPTLEICDHRDNDCDGDYDEDCRSKTKHSVLKVDQGLRAAGLSGVTAPDSDGVIDDITEDLRAEASAQTIGVAADGTTSVLHLVSHTAPDDLAELHLRLFIREYERSYPSSVRAYAYADDGDHVLAGSYVEIAVMRNGWIDLDATPLLASVAGRGQVELRLACPADSINIGAGRLVLDSYR